MLRALLPLRTHHRTSSALLGFLFLCTNALAGDALLSAVKAQDVAAVRSLIDHGADANQPDPDGTTALAWAVHADDETIATALLDAGSNVAAANRYGVGPVFLASENGSARMLELLLDHGADPNQALPDGETPLMTAARAGQADAVRVLLKAGADVHATERRRGQTALMWAAAANNASVVEALLDAGADMHARTLSGEFSALTFAVRAGALQTTRTLLDRGANVNEESRAGTSMLVLSILNGHYELAGVLLDYGADPNADKQGWTALHQVAWTRRWNRGFNLPGPVQTGSLSPTDLVVKLVEAGADINARMHVEPNDGNRNDMNRIGATAFLLAAKSCDLPLMRLLLDLGADPSIKTTDGTTAMMAAAGVGIWAPGENPGTHEEAFAAVKLAFEVGGGGVNDVNAQGDTAVHGAVYRGGALEIIEYLADLGAELDIVNQKGWTPLVAADGVVRNGSGLKHYPEAVELLENLLLARGEVAKR